MKINTPRALLLGAALLGAGTFVATTTTADAAPRYTYRNRPTRLRSVFEGVVTNVRSSTSFDIRVGGRTYNVYTRGVTPRALNRGDIVRVTGRPLYSNDIRNASVRIVRNGYRVR